MQIVVLIGKNSGHLPQCFIHKNLAQIDDDVVHFRISLVQLFVLLLNRGG
jgi:hypothetical protein